MTKILSENDQIIETESGEDILDESTPESEQILTESGEAILAEDGSSLFSEGASSGSGTLLPIKLNGGLVNNNLTVPRLIA